MASPDARKSRGSLEVVLQRQFHHAPAELDRRVAEAVTVPDVAVRETQIQRTVVVRVERIQRMVKEVVRRGTELKILPFRHLERFEDLQFAVEERRTVQIG